MFLLNLEQTTTSGERKKHNMFYIFWNTPLPISVLLATLWSIMLSTSLHHLFAKVTEMCLTRPAKQVIVVSRLHNNYQIKNHLQELVCFHIVIDFSFFTFRLNWRQLGHIWPRWGNWPCGANNWAWIWKTCRSFISFHSWIASCGKSSHVPSLSPQVKEKGYYFSSKICYLLMHKIYVGINKPEMFITSDSFVATVAKELATVIANHFITATGSWDGHFARRALLCTLLYHTHTDNLIDHFPFFSPLFLSKTWRTLTLLQ